MPWTAKQTRFMYKRHPGIAHRVTHEPGFHILPPKRKTRQKIRYRGKK